eukprot:CAMPEP_0195068422 /NCGR_PEP_ID=MMETSP0448-20130528/13157_1 /TAXON_ID=66468 /ORGANISM="Heterocapsa triquestra, Strain CCMP 448" /LENGTH=192 /DNA_ID=CAMNT_0040099951 /DNA_START=33 /DNA_END=611 /DNA_ORIENTATION=+
MAEKQPWREPLDMDSVQKEWRGFEGRALPSPLESTRPPTRTSRPPTVMTDASMFPSRPTTALDFSTEEAGRAVVGMQEPMGSARWRVQHSQSPSAVLVRPFSSDPPNAEAQEKRVTRAQVETKQDGRGNKDGLRVLRDMRKRLYDERIERDKRLSAVVFRPPAPTDPRLESLFHEKPLWMNATRHVSSFGER